MHTHIVPGLKSKQQSYIWRREKCIIPEGNTAVTAAMHLRNTRVDVRLESFSLKAVGRVKAVKMCF